MSQDLISYIKYDEHVDLNNQIVVNEGTFNISLPIKRVEIANQNRIITVEGIYKGNKIGFSLKIPLNVPALLDKPEISASFPEQKEHELNTFAHQIVIEPPKYEATFISTGEQTINLFNALDIGNFKKIKSSVSFIFNNLIGNMEDINENCESDEEAVAIEYSTSMYGRSMKDGDIRLKIATYYDDDLKHRDVNGEEDPQELEFLIAVSPSEKRIHFSEKDTSNRNNLKYTFLDLDKENK